MLLGDLFDVDNSEQWGISASYGDGSFNIIGGTSNNDPQNRFGGTTVGGSYSYSNREGITRATITPGTITLTDNSASETEKTALISTLNRDPQNVQSITREDGFRTGELLLDIGALEEFKGNLKSTRTLLGAVGIDNRANAALRNANGESQIDAINENRSRLLLINQFTQGRDFKDLNLEEKAEVSLNAELALLQGAFSGQPALNQAVTDIASDTEALAEIQNVFENYADEGSPLVITISLEGGNIARLVQNNASEEFTLIEEDASGNIISSESYGYSTELVDENGQPIDEVIARGVRINGETVTGELNPTEATTDVEYNAAVSGLIRAYGVKLLTDKLLDEAPVKAALILGGVRALTTASPAGLAALAVRSQIEDAALEEAGVFVAASAHGEIDDFGNFRTIANNCESVQTATCTVVTQSAGGGTFVVAAVLGAGAFSVGALLRNAWKKKQVVNNPYDTSEITLRDRYNHHDDMQNDIIDKLKGKGYEVLDNVSFKNSCTTTGGRCRPDIIFRKPNGEVYIFEIKTGNADLSLRQTQIFPQIKNGDAIPTGKVAKAFGLIPGVPLKDQGFPNGIKLRTLRFPGK